MGQIMIIQTDDRQTDIQYLSMPRAGFLLVELSPLRADNDSNVLRLGHVHLEEDVLI